MRLSIEQLILRFELKEAPKFVRLLSKARANAQNVITEKELREAMAIGDLPEYKYQELAEIYSKHMAEALWNMYSSGIKVTYEELAKYLIIKEQRATIEAKLTMQAWTRATNLITKINEEQRFVLKSVLDEYVVKRSVSMDELARYVKSVVGLTPKQVQALTKMREALQQENLLSPDKIAKIVEQQAKKIHDWRAETIARTESATILNYATEELVKEGTKQANLRTKKVWYTAADERTCEVCGTMHNKPANEDGFFELPDGDVIEVPPAHPNCRCCVIYDIQD